MHQCWTQLPNSCGYFPAIQSEEKISKDKISWDGINPAKSARSGYWLCQRRSKNAWLSYLSCIAFLMMRIYVSHVSACITPLKDISWSLIETLLQERVAVSLLQRPDRSPACLKFKPSLYLCKEEFHRKQMSKAWRGTCGKEKNKGESRQAQLTADMLCLVVWWQTGRLASLQQQNRLSWRKATFWLAGACQEWWYLTACCWIATFRLFLLVLLGSIKGWISLVTLPCWTQFT